MQASHFQIELSFRHFVKQQLGIRKISKSMLNRITINPENHQKQRNSIPVIIYSMYIQELRPISRKITLEQATAVPFQKTRQELKNFWKETKLTVPLFGEDSRMEMGNSGANGPWRFLSSSPAFPAAVALTLASSFFPQLPSEAPSSVFLLVQLFSSFSVACFIPFLSLPPVFSFSNFLPKNPLLCFPCFSPCPSPLFLFLLLALRFFLLLCFVVSPSSR